MLSRSLPTQVQMITLIGCFRAAPVQTALEIAVKSTTKQPSTRMPKPTYLGNDYSMDAIGAPA